MAGNNFKEPLRFLLILPTKKVALISTTYFVVLHQICGFQNEHIFVWKQSEYLIQTMGTWLRCTFCIGLIPSTQILTNCTCAIISAWSVRKTGRTPKLISIFEDKLIRPVYRWITGNGTAFNSLPFERYTMRPRYFLNQANAMRLHLFDFLLNSCAALLPFLGCLAHPTNSTSGL